jgi:hypothetical protein
MSMTADQKKKLLKAKIAVALHDELGRVPKEKEINQVFLRGDMPYPQDLQSYVLPLYQDWGKRPIILNISKQVSTGKLL